VFSHRISALAEDYSVDFGVEIEAGKDAGLLACTVRQVSGSLAGLALTCCGFQMNFSVMQARGFSPGCATQGLEPSRARRSCFAWHDHLGGFAVLPLFILIGASISGLHFLCLFFGSGLAARIETAHPNLPRALKVLLVLIIANFLFAVSWMALMVVSFGVYEGAIGSLYFIATNLISILLVAGPVFILRFIDRLY
jgi:hypothetical protein